MRDTEKQGKQKKKTIYREWERMFVPMETLMATASTQGEFPLITETMTTIPLHGCFTQ